MTGRKCSTCKHYDPAPIWRKGWCRNPILYAPQQSHLVGEDDLDCERGMGNYWEPADASPNEPDVVGYGAPVQPLTLYTNSPSGREIYTTSGGQPVYTVSGSSGYSGEPPVDPPGDRDRRGAGGPPPGRDRQFTYYPEEHSWLDYVRVAAPILGVILIVILAWIWISTSFLGDDDETGDTGGAQTTRTTLPVISASPTTTARAGATGTPQIIRTAPPAATTPAAAGVPTDTPPDTGGGEIYAGATVEVANTEGAGANMRSDTSTEAEVIAVLLDGTQLVTTGEAIEAEGFVWWPVEGDAGAGYIVADFLILVE